MNEKLHSLMQKEIRKRYSHNLLLGVESADGRVNFQGAAGAATPESPYPIASISKMYTVTVLMQLVDEGRLDLDARLSAYLPADLLQGIHVYKGQDYSQSLRVYQLINHTSGLADYFEGKGKDGRSISDQIKAGEDPAYDLHDVLAMCREIPPNFVPEAGNGRKSHYSDTNYHLLDALIEAITHDDLAQNFRTRIFDRLGFHHTCLYGDKPASAPEPLPVYYKDRLLRLPRLLSSEGGAGGIVSTLTESLRFLRAYFDGELFDPAHFTRMQRWNSLFFPLRYGYGLMHFKLPRPMTLFRYSPELIGHSGTSASFAFYVPRERLYMAGTFNQLDNQGRPFAFMLKVAAAVS